MDQVEFEPAKHWIVTTLKTADHSLEHNLLMGQFSYIFLSTVSEKSNFFCFMEFLVLTYLVFNLVLHCSSLDTLQLLFCFDRETFKEPVLIRSGGGIHNYLYELKFSSPHTGQVKVEGSNILGKLQITWRTNLGEPGRLQTQHIVGNVS